METFTQILKVLNYISTPANHFGLSLGAGILLSLPMWVLVIIDWYFIRQRNVTLILSSISAAWLLIVAFLANAALNWFTAWYTSPFILPALAPDYVKYWTIFGVLFGVPVLAALVALYGIWYELRRRKEAVG